MAQTNRVNLKSYFLTGSKPTQSQFADLVDSLINIKDDGIVPDGSGNIIFNQGVILGNNSLDTAGSIRWNGTNFQFRDGAGWNNLSFGANSQWTTVTGGINLLTGGVGIGLAANTAPVYKLEVNLGLSNGTADQVRFGNATILGQLGNAYFSHKAQANNTSYALLQDATGQTILNTASGISMLFCEANAVRAALNKGVFCIGASAPPSGATQLLFVNGDAGKPGGGGFTSIGSDEKLKTGISPFEDGLASLKKLRPVNYRYNGKAGIANTKAHVGLIAQEVQEVFPYMVGHFKAKLEEKDTEETDLLSLDANALTYVMVNAIKELDARLARLEPKKSKTTTQKHTL
jgi:hypothetical protein